MKSIATITDAMFLFIAVVIACSIILFAEAHYGSTLYDLTYDTYLNFYVLQAMNCLYNIQIEIGSGKYDYLMTQILKYISVGDYDSANELLIRYIPKIFDPIKDNYYFYVILGYRTGNSMIYISSIFKYDKKWYNARIDNIEFKTIVSEIIENPKYNYNIYSTSAPILIEKGGKTYNGHIYVGFLPKLIPLEKICEDRKVSLSWEEIK
jgi:hypothetical protein